MSNSWTGMDQDDIPGYLMDSILTWLSNMNIDSQEDFDEAFQNDEFHDELQDFAENVIQAALEYKK